MSLSDFQTNETENTAFSEFLEDIKSYMLHKYVVHKSTPNKTFLGMQECFSVMKLRNTDKSNVAYHKLIDATADNKETMMAMLHNLEQQYIVTKLKQFLVVERDTKLLEMLWYLKHEYGEASSWLIPFPGDWHMLKNYQNALMKAYYIAGLESIAKAAGYPVQQIKSNFKRHTTSF